MKITHIVPGYSAAGSLREALRISGRDDGLLVFGDDLSCGPIASGDPTDRVDWWNKKFDWPEIEENIRGFRTELDELEGKLVIWFGRHSARELAFRHAWAWAVYGRPYHIIDVTGLTIPVKWGNGTDGIIQSAQALSIIPATGLTTLLDSEREASPDEEAAYGRHWLTLMAEMHHSASLLRQALSQHKRTASIISSLRTQALNGGRLPVLLAMCLAQLVSLICR